MDKPVDMTDAVMLIHSIREYMNIKTVEDEINFKQQSYLSDAPNMHP